MINNYNNSLVLFWSKIRNASLESEPPFATESSRHTFFGMPNKKNFLLITTKSNSHLENFVFNYLQNTNNFTAASFCSSKNPIPEHVVNMIFSVSVVLFFRISLVLSRFVFFSLVFLNIKMKTNISLACSLYQSAAATVYVCLCVYGLRRASLLNVLFHFLFFLFLLFV